MYSGFFVYLHIFEGIGLNFFHGDVIITETWDSWNVTVLRNCVSSCLFSQKLFYHTLIFNNRFNNILSQLWNKQSRIRSMPNTYQICTHVTFDLRSDKHELLKIFWTSISHLYQFWDICWFRKVVKMYFHIERSVLITALTSIRKVNYCIFQ